MMRNFSIRSIVLAIAWLLTTTVANAIPTTCEVTLESTSGNEVTLISAATAPKAKEAEAMAVKQAFYALINHGVDGLHSGQPMLSTPSKQFDYTFYKENKYQNFLTATPVKIDESKIGTNRRVRVLVTINAKRLLDNLANAKLQVSPAWQDKKKTTATVSLNPTIVVVPYLRGDDQSFQAMKELVDKSPAMKQAVNTVGSQFASHGYKTRDFIATLNNSNTADIMREGSATDAQTMVIQELPGDIVVTVDLDLHKSGNKAQCTVTLNAVERQTAGKLGSVSYASGQYITNDFVTLTDYALKKVEKKFFDQMSEAFAQMVEKGREVNVEFLLGETVSDWDFDVETPLAGGDFKEELEEWLRDNANHGIYDMSRSSDKFINVSVNVPLWDTERNRSYTLSNFNSALKKFIKSQIGDDYKVNLKAMGQKIIVTIE